METCTRKNGTCTAVCLPICVLCVRTCAVAALLLLFVRAWKITGCCLPLCARAQYVTVMKVSSSFSLSLPWPRFGRCCLYAPLHLSISSYDGSERWGRPPMARWAGPPSKGTKTSTSAMATETAATAETSSSAAALATGGIRPFPWLRCQPLYTSPCSWRSSLRT